MVFVGGGDMGLVLRDVCPGGCGGGKTVYHLTYLAQPVTINGSRFFSDKRPKV